MLLLGLVLALLFLASVLASVLVSVLDSVLWLVGVVEWVGLFEGIEWAALSEQEVLVVSPEPEAWVAGRTVEVGRG